MLLFVCGAMHVVSHVCQFSCNVAYHVVVSVVSCMFSLHVCLTCDYLWGISMNHCTSPIFLWNRMCIFVYFKRYVWMVDFRSFKPS